MNKVRVLFLLLILCFSAKAEMPSVENFGWTPPQNHNYSYSPSPDLPINSLFEGEEDQLSRESDSYLPYRQLYLTLKKRGELTSEELSSGRLSSLNQGSVGSCVGFSTTIALDVTACYNERLRSSLRQESKFRFNPDAIYAIGRQNNLGRWDGSTGQWSMKGITDIGTLHRRVYDNGVNLVNTKRTDGRTWSLSGLPSGFKEAASERKVISFERVKDTKQAKELLKNGYVIVICAQASYPHSRDSLGFSRRTGRAWAHAMCVLSYRDASTGREGFLIQNSWGDTWNGGAIWPNDMPRGSFWVTPKDLQFHLDQQDSWAIGEYDGFPKRSIKWREAFTFTIEEK